MLLGKDFRPYLYGTAINLITGKPTPLIFLIDTGSTSGQLPPALIDHLGSVHSSRLVSGSLGEELFRDYYHLILIELPGIDQHNNHVTLSCEEPVGIGTHDDYGIIGADQLAAMRAKLVINYASKQFYLRKV